MHWVGQKGSFKVKAPHAPSHGAEKKRKEVKLAGQQCWQNTDSPNSKVQIYDPIAGVHIYDYTTDGEIWFRARGGRIFDFTEQTVKKKSFIM